MNNNKKTVKDILNDMEANDMVIYDIGGRGGTYGAAAGDVLTALFPTLDYDELDKLSNMLPNKIGVYCNYLGGGLRGALCRSSYSKELPAKYARRIDAFTRECVRRYNDIENGAGLNAEEYPDGDTNWEAIGTNKSRAAGIESAY